MNWKATLHSAVVAVVGVIAGVLEQYFENGGVIPQNAQQWHAFIGSVSGTILVGILALLKQSPIQPTQASAPAQPQEAPKP